MARSGRVLIKLGLLNRQKQRRSLARVLRGGVRLGKVLQGTNDERPLKPVALSSEIRQVTLLPPSKSTRGAPIEKLAAAGASLISPDGSVRRPMMCWQTSHFEMVDISRPFSKSRPS
jgi:hypothetical protein